MRIAHLLASFIAVAGTASVGLAQGTFTDTFDGATANESAWTWTGPAFNPFQVGTTTVEPAGGHPGAYLRGSGLLGAVPAVSTTNLGSETQFTGDYRARAVTAISVEFAFNNATPLNDTNGRDLYLFLSDDNGTPGDADDDCLVYTFLPDAGPISDDGWHPAQFAIPSDSTTLPSGWAVFGCSGSRDHAWQNVITDVDNVSFVFGNPFVPWLAIPRTWDIRMDNVSITTGASGCPGDRDGNGLVDVFDLLDYLDAWFAGAADRTGDGTTDVFDLLDYLDVWFAGC